MTLTAIDAVINDQRLNANRAQVEKSMRLIKQSAEFCRIVNTTTAMGLSHLGIDAKEHVGPMLEFVENAMALAVEIGHSIAEQEIGARELEAFFGNEALKETNNA